MKKFIIKIMLAASFALAATACNEEKFDTHAHEMTGAAFAVSLDAEDAAQNNINDIYIYIFGLHTNSITNETYYKLDRELSASSVEELAGKLASVPPKKYRCFILVNSRDEINPDYVYNGLPIYRINFDVTSSVLSKDAFFGISDFEVVEGEICPVKTELKNINSDLSVAISNLPATAESVELNLLNGSKSVHSNEFWFTPSVAIDPNDTQELDFRNSTLPAFNQMANVTNNSADFGLMRLLPLNEDLATVDYSFTINFADGTSETKTLTMENTINLEQPTNLALDYLTTAWN